MINNDKNWKVTSKMTDYIACPLLRSLQNTLKLPFYTHFQIYPHRNRAEKLDSADIRKHYI